MKSSSEKCKNRNDYTYEPIKDFEYVGSYNSICFWSEPFTGFRLFAYLARENL